MFIELLKKNFIVLACAVILLICVFVIVFILFTTPPTSLPEEQEVTPTPYVSNEIPEEDQTTNPPYTLDKDATISLFEKINNQEPLSVSDEEAKTKILSHLPAGEVSGIIYRSPNVIIDYTRSADSFMAEITTSNINLAKKEANDWFLSQGMSQETICNYPLQFFLGPQVSLPPQREDLVFNPLAPGCQ